MGWMLCAQAAGGILGGLAGARAAGRFRPVALAATCMALFGLLDLAIFNYPRWTIALWPAIVLFFLVGIPGCVGYVAMLTLFQLQAPDRLRGRMYAVLSVGQATAGMLGATVAGAARPASQRAQPAHRAGAGYLLAALLLRLLAGRGPDSLAQPGLAGPPGLAGRPGRGASATEALDQRAQDRPRLVVIDAARVRPAEAADIDSDVGEVPSDAVELEH